MPPAGALLALIAVAVALWLWLVAFGEPMDEAPPPWDPETDGERDGDG